MWLGSRGLECDEQLQSGQFHSTSEVQVGDESTTRCASHSWLSKRYVVLPELSLWLNTMWAAIVHNVFLSTCRFAQALLLVAPVALLLPQFTFFFHEISFREALSCNPTELVNVCTLKMQQIRKWTAVEFRRDTGWRERTLWKLSPPRRLLLK